MENGAQSRRQLLDYVDAVTDEEGQDFIPVKDRVAVFDFDGTLFCETDPNYFDYMLLKHRVLDDPDYQTRHPNSNVRLQTRSGSRMKPANRSAVSRLITERRWHLHSPV